MRAYPSVVVFKEKVYIGGGAASSARNGRIVMVYDPKQDSCNTHTPYAYNCFSMAVVNDQLVLVGGIELLTDKKTNKIGVWNEQSKTWTHPLPPMTTACYSPSVATHNNRWLVVMGGRGDTETSLSRVEILDTIVSVQWYQATSLPHPCHQVSSATIGNMCYLLGGFTNNDPVKKVYSVCLDDLISQAVSQPPRTSAPSTPSPWQSLPNTPLTHSTALAFNGPGALLAVGGDYLGSSAIHVYQPSSNSWVKAGELSTERCDSGCIVLPSGEMLVAGGGDHETKRKVEITSILTMKYGNYIL